MKGLLAQSPGEVGYASSNWALPLLAQAAYAEGLTRGLGRAWRRVGVRWQRAKPGLDSPDGHYTAKKTDGTG